MPAGRRFRAVFIVLSAGLRDVRTHVYYVYVVYGSTRRSIATTIVDLPNARMRCMRAQKGTDENRRKPTPTGPGLAPSHGRITAPADM